MKNEKSINELRLEAKKLNLTWNQKAKILKVIENDPTKWDTKDEMQEKYENSLKYNYKEFCYCCGRGIKGTPKFYIWTVEGPDLVPITVTEEDMARTDSAPQGAFPIGSECRKLYPKEYVGKVGEPGAWWYEC